PCKPLAVEARAATACSNVIRGPDEGDAGPAVKRVVGVDRTQPAEGKPPARAEVRRTELVGKNESDEGREHQPKGGGQGIGRKHPRQRGVRRFRGAPPVNDGYGALLTCKPAAPASLSNHNRCSP